MNFKIDITKVNIPSGQRELDYYIATLFVNNTKLTTQCYSTFSIKNIKNVDDAINLISLRHSDDSLDKGEILKIALQNSLVEYTFSVDTENEYITNYGEYKILAKNTIS